MSLIRHSVYNLAGFAIPTLIAIPCLGILARTLGPESFGLFTLSFAIVGYASIFDGGITRAVIREVSMLRDNLNEQQKVIGTATVVVLSLGIIASLILYFSAGNLASLLKVSQEQFAFAVQSFKILSVIIPVYLVSQIWLAYLEGIESFANINIQRVISSSLLALLPTLLVLYHHSLVYATIGLLIGRVITLLMAATSVRVFLRNVTFRVHKATLIRLIKFGSWMTVSNIISPIMVYFDRFVISSLLGANKIAFYTAPAEGVARLLNIPTALSRALFPKLSNAQDKKERKKLEVRSYYIISLVCLPIVIIGGIFSSYILSTWLGPQYAGDSSVILCILLVGFYFNALAQIPFSTIQAKGNSKITAGIHALEIIPYLILLFILTNHFGLIGTAIAWSLRTFSDLVLLVIFSRR
ncbi:oligosaccharide flippase family protein [Leclercia sp. J807]|uniref:flippase n=1 Tax=Leclercia sp. J807 TaxID=2681307 RepID=UPI0012E1B8F7|nr:flippase [Leclercia sp. J807]QGU11518.1 oligosaccharide flippase family protein [Leclercia sp. J807]